MTKSHRSRVKGTIYSGSITMKNTVEPNEVCESFTSSGVEQNRVKAGISLIYFPERKTVWWSESTNPAWASRITCNSRMRKHLIGYNISIKM